MVKISLWAALASILALSSAQDDYDDYDDCYEPDETTTASTAYLSTSLTSIVSSSEPLATANSSNAYSCPILPSPTFTDTVYAYTQIATVSQIAQATTIIYAATVTISVPQPTDQTSISFATETKASYTETVSVSPYFTSVVFDGIPATTTVTIPRATNFTPLKCEAAYVGPFSTTTISYTTTVSTYTYTTITSNSTTTNVIFPPTLIFPSVTIDSTTTITTQPTITVTSTRADPTSTVYAACLGTDNVTPDAPPSKYKYLGQPLGNAGTYSSVIAAIDPADCCALCQANDQCTGSTFYKGFILGGIRLNTHLVNTACQLFLKNASTSATCDPTFIGATMQFDYPEIINYYSNGPCGQFNFTFDYPRLVNGITL